MNLPVRVAPGAAFLAYFVGTALVYFWGPWNYPMPAGSGPLIAFLTAVHVAFAVGYLAGVQGAPRTARIRLPIDRLVLISVVIQLALLFPLSHYNTGRWIPNPWAALSDFGGVYVDSLARRQSGVPYVNYIRILLGPLIALAIPFGVFYWRDLRTFTKCLFVASIVGTLLLYVAMGTNVAAGEWMALFPWFVLAGHLSGVQRLDARGWLKAAGIQALSVALFAVLFSTAMVERDGSFARWGSLGRTGATLERKPTASASTSTSGRFPAVPRRTSRTPPSRLRIGFNGLAGYLTQGYYAVYLSLREPFVPCYGVGHSAFLQRQAVRVTGFNELLDCTYPVRIQERGWNAMAYWATIYPWIASDVTFPGTIVVVFFIGFLTAKVWVDVVGGRNPFAVALLGQLLLMLYFFPAHNRVMQMGENVTALLVFLAAWLWTRQPEPANR